VAITSEDPVTAVRTATGWLTAHDPGLVAFRRALRVTVAASVGFFVCRYVLDAPVIATYAVFAAIALGVLSDISGPPALRTGAYLAALPVGLALVAIGTAAARSTPAAVLGMLVVGFAVAYAGVGGPRLTGIANGLQLFYILPCFPPYDPGALPQRLAGLTIGILLAATADRLLWPAPAPPAFTDRLADAADAVGRFVAAVDTDHTDGPREEAEAVVAGLRPSSVPLGSRPTGPGRRDRGLTHAASALRTMVLRMGVIAALLPDVRSPVARVDADELLGIVGDTLASCAAALRGSGPPPESGAVVAGVAHYLEGRAGRIADRIDTDELPPVLRIGGLTAAVGEPPADWPWPPGQARMRHSTRRRPCPRPPGISPCPSPSCGGDGCWLTSPHGRCTSRTLCGWRSASPRRGWPPTCSTSPTGSGCCSRR
jgi:hypothetical protein